MPPPLLYGLDAAALVLLAVMMLAPMGRAARAAAQLGVVVVLAFLGLPLLLPLASSPPEPPMATWPSPDASHAEITTFLTTASMPPPPFVCAACGHNHAGPALAGICVGCPCPHKGGLRPAPVVAEGPPAP